MNAVIQAPVISRKTLVAGQMEATPLFTGGGRWRISPPHLVKTTPQEAHGVTFLTDQIDDCGLLRRCHGWFLSAGRRACHVLTCCRGEWLLPQGTSGVLGGPSSWSGMPDEVQKQQQMLRCPPHCLWTCSLLFSAFGSTFTTASHHRCPPQTSEYR